MIKKIIAFLFLALSMNTYAQGPEMADGLRADGKIFVVITVIALIFIALVVWLVMTERKIKKLEDKLNNK